MFSLMTRDQLLQSPDDRLSSPILQFIRGLNVSRVLPMMTFGGVLDELDELVVLGNEVGLSVDLDDNTDLALGAVISVDHAPQQQYGQPSWQR